MDETIYVTLKVQFYFALEVWFSIFYVVDGKADTIVSEVVKLFQRKGIPLTYM